MSNLSEGGEKGSGRTGGREHEAEDSQTGRAERDEEGGTPPPTGDDGNSGDAREHRKCEKDEQQVCAERESEGVDRARLFARLACAERCVEVLGAFAAADPAVAGTARRAGNRRTPPSAAQQRRCCALRRKRRHRAEAVAKRFAFKVIAGHGAAAIASGAKAAGGARDAARRVAVREEMRALRVAPTRGVDRCIHKPDAVLRVVDASRCGVHARREWRRREVERSQCNAPAAETVRTDRRRDREVLLGGAPLRRMERSRRKEGERREHAAPNEGATRRHSDRAAGTHLVAVDERRERRVARVSE